MGHCHHEAFHSNTVYLCQVAIVEIGTEKPHVWTSECFAWLLTVMYVYISINSLAVVVVEALTESGKTCGPLSRDFFRREYTLNYLTSKFLTSCNNVVLCDYDFCTTS